MIEASSTALVTGASSGIGEQLARQLAARGLNLVLVARSEQRLRALAEELYQAHAGISVTVMAADLSAAGAADELAENLTAAQTPVNLLVNNAGIGSRGLVAEQDPDAAVRQIQLNCGSLAALTTRLLPPMIARRRGGVLNVASKAFVLSFTETAGSGKEFLTSGRQTPERVAAAALRALESGRGPSVIPGAGNRMLASGYRFFPRSVMVRMAERNVRAA